MMRNKYTIAFIIVLCISQMTVAQRLSVNVPGRVQVGETFRLEYSINTVDVNGELRLPEMPDGLEVVFGPSVSRQQSYNIYNGHASSQASITYTYMLMAKKAGTFNIPAAHLNVGGSNVASAPVKVTATGAAQQHQGTRFHQEEEEQHHLRAAGAPVTQRDLFIRVSANKTRVHEQEPILLTYKVYTLVDLTQLEGKMPELNGFHSQEVELPQQKTFHTETIDGRTYRCVTWSQYVMYPQMTGTLEIPSITFKGIVVQENRNVDPFEAFFNGGSGYVEVKRDIVAPGLTVHVDPLPQRPANFSGGVGHFNISAQIDKAEVKAGDPVNIRVVVGGNGNLKLLKQPEVNLPKDFEKYEAKITDKTKLTSNGVEGNMVYDILTVPRHQGNYTIPPIEMTYYDTSANQYRTVKTQSFTVNVTPGDGGDEVEDEGEMKVKDIYPIRTGKTEQHSLDDYFFMSPWYWIWIIIPLMVFVALMMAFHKRAVERANIGKMRGKKANKVAIRRLKKANQLMGEGKNSEFYDEVLRALWGYVGDKMNMPVAELSRENVMQELSSRGVSEPVANEFVGALDECEFERYAPGDPMGNMSKTYNSAMNAITRIENEIKTAKTKNKTGVSAFLIMALCLPLSTMAITKENADAEYNKGNYQQAIHDYEELLHKGVSADLYFNLGNAYYRTDNITRAIINYERAFKLSPGDEDIRFNLQLAQSKTIDKISPESEMFFVTGYHSLVNSKSIDQWAYLAIGSIITMLVLVLIYLFSGNVILRKVGFFGAAFMLLLFILSNIFAYQQRRQLKERDTAIVTTPTVNVRKTPKTDAAAAFVIHEGTKVKIIDKSISDWMSVKLADGREGWLLTNQVEEI